MDTRRIDLHLSVREVLQKWPETLFVFMKHKTYSVGCFMQKFCTLNDVAEVYHLSPEELIDELIKASDDGK